MTQFDEIHAALSQSTAKESLQFEQLSEWADNPETPNELRSLIVAIVETCNETALIWQQIAEYNQQQQERSLGFQKRGEELDQRIE